MDIMDIARLNIKKKRKLKGLLQQDMAEKLNMNIRSYQNLENGDTRLDLERLSRIAEVLDTKMEDLIKSEGFIIHQEIKEASGSGSGTGIYNNYGIEKEVFDKFMAAKDAENRQLKEENKYLKEKIDQLMVLMGKKG